MNKYFEFGLSEASKWQEYLDKMDDSKKDIYYSPDYYRLYEELGDGQAKCFVFDDGENFGLYPFLLNSVNKLGYKLKDVYYDIQGAYGYNGVLYSSPNENFIAAFDDSFAAYCAEKNIIAEFSRFHPIFRNEYFSNKRMRIVNDRETVFLNLQADPDDIWKNQYTSKNRNMIRKASKMGYISEAISYPTRQEVIDFINMYHQNMKMVNADQYFFFNDKYFLDTFRYLGQYAYLFNVKDAVGDIVSSSIFFKYGDYFHYHLSGRSKEADNSVNNFLISEAVKFAKEKGAKILHLGGGRTNSSEDSLLRFKKSFSKNTSLFSIGKKIIDKHVYDFISNEWEKNNPESQETYKNYLLKYRIKKK